MADKRVTLFAGHYGSGKTNLAVNYALALKRRGCKVLIADLDIVNPYFRAKDSQSELNTAGVRLISSAFANSNVDLPAMPQEAYAIIDDRSYMAIIDVGGDDRGATALGRYAPAILEENDYDMAFVANFYRPLTRDAASALSVMREIEASCGIGFTSIVNNSNLGRETTVKDVLDTLPMAQKLSEISGVPLKYTAINEAITEHIPEGFVPISLHYKPNWDIWEE